MLNPQAAQRPIQAAILGSDPWLGVASSAQAFAPPPPPVTLVEGESQADGVRR